MEQRQHLCCSTQTQHEIFRPTWGMLILARHSYQNTITLDALFFQCRNPMQKLQPFTAISVDIYTAKLYKWVHLLPQAVCLLSALCQNKTAKTFMQNMKF